MDYIISKIHLSIESQGNDPNLLDFTNENTDVIVEMVNGCTYIASFFAYDNLKKLREQNNNIGAFLNGRYFWASSMILVDNLFRETIIEVINDLIDEGNFELAFCRL